MKLRHQTRLMFFGAKNGQEALLIMHSFKHVKFILLLKLILLGMG
jgi:hypothetical protein